MKSPRAVSAFQVLWQGMGAWKWPSLLLIAICVALTPAAGPSPTAGTWSTLPEKQAGPLNVRAATSGQWRRGAHVRVKLQVTGVEPQRTDCRIEGARWEALDVHALQPPDEALATLVVPETAERFLLQCALHVGSEYFAVSWDLGHPVPFTR